MRFFVALPGFAFSLCQLIPAPERDKPKLRGRMTQETLSGPEQPPAAGGQARQLVVLLHGVGSDGNDLIALAEPWSQLLPHAHFISPHGPAPYDMAPMGRQWFSLKDFSNEALLEGAIGAAPILDAFVDAKLAALGLDDRRLAFVGFSQGTMMSLYVAYRRVHACAAVLGYSGRLIGAERLETELRSRPPAMLIHGEADELIPAVESLLTADALGGQEVLAQWHISAGVGHGVAPDGLEIGGRFLAEMFAAA